MTSPGADPGLQPERTELSWRRTALSLAIGSLIAMRLLPEALGHGVWVIPSVLGLLASAAIWAAGRRRYVRSSAAMAGGRDELPDGRLLLLLVSVATAIGGLAIALVILL